MEPDPQEGYREACGGNTVVSARCGLTSKPARAATVLNSLTKPSAPSDAHPTHRSARPMITLAQAAAQTGMVRSSILRAIKRGALSGIRNPDGTWLVDPAELPRLLREHSGHPPTRSPRRTVDSRAVTISPRLDGVTSR